MFYRTFLISLVFKINFIFNAGFIFKYRRTFISVASNPKSKSEQVLLIWEKAMQYSYVSLDSNMDFD